jgi:hypothetical protein
LQSREAADKEKLRMKRRENNETPFRHSIIFIRSFALSAASLSLLFQAKLCGNSHMVPALPG